MPNKTSKLGLNTWLENEPVNFEEVNANFEKIDGFVTCIESGTTTAAYEHGADSVATWRYKKYSDGTVEMATKLNFANAKCDGGDAAPYATEDSNIFFPFSFTDIYNIQTHLSSSTVGWVLDVTDKTVLDHLTLRVLSMTKENESVAKQIFVTVKGVL